MSARRKTLVVVAAGLGWNLLEHHKPATRIPFRPILPCPLSLTCPAQATMRTGALPSSHGVTASGWYHRDLARPYFWEQSAALVRGPRVWDSARARGETVGMAFWQQSLGERLDLVLSPKPVHRHHGGIVMDCYTRPEPLYADLCRAIGRKFDLFRYWGPLSGERVGRWEVAAACEILRRDDAPDHFFFYLSSLDYAQQRHGPGSPQAAAALRETLSQLDTLLAAADDMGYAWLVAGDYAVEPVTLPDGAVFPNRALRDAGVFHTRAVAGMLYPDFYTSRAFAIVDHQIAHVHVPAPDDRPAVRRLLENLDGVDSVLDPDAQRALGLWHEGRSGDFLLVAAPGRWFAYPWWTSARQAPDYASQMDIHNKPGFDPCELFFGFPPPHTSQNASRIRGTHGRSGPGHEIAAAGLFPDAPDFLSLATALARRFDTL